MAYLFIEYAQSSKHDKTWLTAGGAIHIALWQHWQTWKLHHYDVI